nr:MAG TPA: hypothetical protein [Herelleviridae sp.]
MLNTVFVDVCSLAIVKNFYFIINKLFNFA